ncbi:MAG TPA: IS5 family transposase [Candidatus Acidoferrales bacterium]|nr:IS5 family transposase [Candidatus Acidoferrales bacterium]
MRGDRNLQNPMFFVANTEERLAADHPLRAIKRQADEVLKAMSGEFEAAYSETGRPSIPPEALLKAMLLQGLYSIPSERRLVDALNWNLLYRWFCDLDPDAEVWDATSFTKNRERFERHGLVQKFFERVVAVALVKRYASNDHFTVDGTLIQSWASLKSFRPKNEKAPGPPESGSGNPSVNFRGQKRSNETHQSTTDPEARLARKGNNVGAYLCHSGHVLAENRHGLCLDIRVASADGHAEREMAAAMLRRFRQRHRRKPRTLGGDAGYEAGQFLQTVEEDLKIQPHIPISAERVTTPGPEGDARRRMLRRMKTRAYQLSQRTRKKVEQVFGWLKQPGGLRKVRHVGRWKIQQVAYLWAAAYNLLRMANLELQQAGA